MVNDVRRDALRASLAALFTANRARHAALARVRACLEELHPAQEEAMSQHRPEVSTTGHLYLLTYIRQVTDTSVPGKTRVHQPGDIFGMPFRYTASRAASINAQLERDGAPWRWVRK